MDQLVIGRAQDQRVEVGARQLRRWPAGRDQGAVGARSERHHLVPGPVAGTVGKDELGPLSRPALPSSASPGVFSSATLARRQA